MSSKDIFRRGHIANALGISYALVKNWSRGRPFAILPTIHAPGKQGSANLYSRRELYLMGIANCLIRQGLRAEFVSTLLPLFRPKWFAKNNRGLVFYGQSRRGDLAVKCIPHHSSQRTLPINALGMQVWGVLDLDKLLTAIDRKADL